MRVVGKALLPATSHTAYDQSAWMTRESLMSLLAAVGVVLGVPAGIVVGRFLWKQFAESYPVAYAPPLALIAVLLAAPVAVAISNILALGPARSATSTSPAEVLRSE